jgi:transposase-like protein
MARTRIFGSCVVIVPHVVRWWYGWLFHSRAARRELLADVAGAALASGGLHCARCRSTARRLFRAQGSLPAYRCRTCDGYCTLLTGTVFAKTRQRPATLVLLLRGIAKGEPAARLVRELGVSRKQLHTLRQRIQANLNATVPTGVMLGTAFEAAELYQNAGEKKYAPSRSHRSTP